MNIYELLEPFASESIYTEALLDAILRRGIGNRTEEDYITRCNEEELNI